MQVYLSEKPNLLDGFEEKRIGKAVIKEVSVKRVKELTEREAKLCTHKGLEDLKNALKKWYTAEEDSIVTFVRFELEIF